MDEEEKSVKLENVRVLFEEAVDHTRDAHAEAHRAERFYHNTRLEGQWDANDLAYLRDQGRPALSFNIVKDKVDSFLGMYADAQRTPVVTGSGGEDALLAEAIDIVKDQVLQDARYERKASGQLKTGTIAGECGIQVEVVPSSKGADWVQINLHRVMPFELHWDPASIEADRSDARHFFWDRWMSKGDFEQEYPDHAKEWASLSNAGDPSDYDASVEWSEHGADSFGDGLDDYDGEKHSRYYFDRQKRKIRVIRYEYKVWHDAYYVTDTRTGDRQKANDEQLERVQFAIDELGAPFEIEVAKEEIVKVCEFVGAKMLAEYDSPGPFDGFSVVPYVYMIDEEEGTAYGLVRNLFDPQSELNKSKSLEIEYIANTIAPGTIAEVDALVDEKQFMDANRRPNGVPLVKSGKIGSIIQKQPAPPSAAIIQRGQNAMDLVDKISGIPSSGMVQPASQAEAATTVALRYHKSRQVVQDPIANYEHAQHEIVRRVVEAIARSMPDDQIQAILGNDQRFQVGNGVIVEMAADPNSPNGQWVPKARALMRDMRSLDWNIELEHSSENSTLRMMEFEVFMQMQAAGFPVDPEIVYETSTSSRSQRERLVAFYEQQLRAQQQGSQVEAQTFREQMAAQIQVEMAKVQESQRHNQAAEAIDLRKLQADYETKVATILEKADEGERAFLLSLLQAVAQPQITRGGMR